jgi:NADPH-dependent F420 reductase
LDESLNSFIGVNMADTKPVVAILGGTGKEGPGLAMRWAVSGYKIIIGSRQREKAERTAEALNESLGIDTITGLENGDAAKCADICVLTVVQSAHKSALVKLKDALYGKILVDATARVDFRNPQPPQPPSAAEIAQEILGSGVKVVAAFQNVPAHSLRNLDKAIDSEVLVCADDTEVATQVIRLAENGGMKAYYAGSLDNAITIEGLTAVLISINRFYKTKSASVRITGITS